MVVYGQNGQWLCLQLLGDDTGSHAITAGRCDSKTICVADNVVVISVLNVGKLMQILRTASKKQTAHPPRHQTELRSRLLGITRTRRRSTTRLIILCPTATR